MPGWRTGWLAVGGGDRLNDVLAAITKLAEGRLCSTMPMQRAIVAALTGDRSHQAAFRTALRERAELVLHGARTRSRASRRHARRAAFYAMPKIELPPGKTDADFVIELVHATGVLCVHGSGFGMDPADGYFRMVTLAPPSQLNEIWDLIAGFTAGIQMRVRGEGKRETSHDLCTSPLTALLSALPLSARRCCILASLSCSPGRSPLGLTRDIPWDLGDSLLNAWILAWDADHLLRFLSGDFDALRNFWNANIFYPEPLTLAYSEHLFAQAVQILPIYALTGNIILCYNLLFLSTFVLSGLGMFLFVREVTGSPRAGFVAGLIYAFAPYRVPQFAHLQVISSQWMPFVLYGLRRYFLTHGTSHRSSAPVLRSSRRTCRTATSCCSLRRSCWRTCCSRSPRGGSGPTRACGSRWLSRRWS